MVMEPKYYAEKVTGFLGPMKVQLLKITENPWMGLGNEHPASGYWGYTPEKIERVCP